MNSAMAGATRAPSAMLEPFRQCGRRFVVAAANSCWLAASYPAYRRFVRAIQRPHESQEDVLREIVGRNAASAFGKKHRFLEIKSVADFRKHVPLSSYDTLSSAIDRIRSGNDPAALTAERVRIFEKSSGSGAAAKYIPYTDSLCAEFQAAVRAWIVDLYRSDPLLLCGRSYWLITPLSRKKEVTPSGIPVGFESDAEYLGALERRIAETLFAVPSELARVPAMEASLYLTLRFLLQCGDLALISVWNPSYLSILMDRLQQWAPKLLADLHDGTASAAFLGQQKLPESLRRRLRAHPARAARLRQILCANGRLATADVWPGLRLISCWTEAAARQCVGDISRRFPGVRIQGKGLLATEGVVTIPWGAAGGCIPALRSHFYEFLPADGESQAGARMMDELEAGATYSLAITTGGGLYRYQLGDCVKVRGFCPRTGNGIPVLEFVGRIDGVSDLRGEKLSPLFVQAAVDKVLAHEGVPLSAIAFCMLAPCRTENEESEAPCYVLYLELTGCERARTVHAGVAERLDSALRENPHYDYCRGLGQLSGPRIFRITCGAREAYLQRCVALGQRAGNVKPASLHRSPGWESVFNGAFVTEPEMSPESKIHHRGALC